MITFPRAEKDFFSKRQNVGSYVGRDDYLFSYYNRTIKKIGKKRYD